MPSFIEVLDRHALGGDLPLQDHRGTDAYTDFAPHFRACVMATRVVGRTKFGKWITQGHAGSESALKATGDLIGAIRVPNKPGARATPAYAFAVPVITTRASKKTKRPDPKKTRTREQQQSEVPRNVQVLPVRTGNWDPDLRHNFMNPVVHKNAPNMPASSSSSRLAW